MSTGSLGIPGIQKFHIDEHRIPDVLGIHKFLAGGIDEHRFPGVLGILQVPCI